ncbi:hypothetical protein MHIB_15630 [Mycolicibacter hiberniae]|uniref:Dienelactone hydrolase domain-containing protein n=1 Tax=Mycolicibacter hiberniae TaxID=29314 RepID=A0A7I7X1U6_9MYCO|nr:hypothetical protein MHIB_15630 [Mycolicibacter hiberniae]
MQALLDVPQGSGPWPGVVLVHDAIGYGRDMRAVSRRVAAGDRLRAVAEKHHIPHDIKVYRDAGHSFANRLPAQPLLRIAGYGYNEAAAADAWNRVFAFFAQHLRPGA